MGPPVGLSGKRLDLACKIEHHQTREGGGEGRENTQREVKRGIGRWFCWLRTWAKKMSRKYFSIFFFFNMDWKVQKFNWEWILSSLSSQGFCHLCFLEANIPSAIARWALFSSQLSHKVICWSSFSVFPFPTLDSVVIVKAQWSHLRLWMGRGLRCGPLWLLFWFPSRGCPQRS